MNIRLTINGFEDTVHFDDAAISGLFLPILQAISRRQRELGRRMTVFLAAPPGTGKSTLAAFLEQLSRETPGLTPLQALGMDGFHHHQDYILSHTALCCGREVPMRLIKGAPESFDLEKLRQTLSDIRSDSLLWPLYDRRLHDVVENAIPVQAPIVLVEGNWLLLDEPGWSDLPHDAGIFIHADPEQLRRRLVERKMRGGTSREEAEAHYLRSDGPNVLRCLSRHLPADWTLTMTGTGAFQLNGKENPYALSGDHF